jgi:hypothetical protein
LELSLATGQPRGRAQNLGRTQAPRRATLLRTAPLGPTPSPARPTRRYVYTAGRAGLPQPPHAALRRGMQTGFDSPEQLHNSIHIAKGRGRKFKPVCDIRVSSKMDQLVPKVEFRNKVITIRTLLSADVRASLSLGQTHAKCIRDSGTASEQCGKIGDLAILIGLRYASTG